VIAFLGAWSALIGGAVLLSTAVAEQVLLIKLWKERRKRQVGSWKDLFTSAGRIIGKDENLANRLGRLKAHRVITIAAGIGGCGLIIGSLTLNVSR
jgi:hypothetical protein